MVRVNGYAEFLSNYIKAGSDNTPAQVLEELAHSEIDRIRLRVAENPSAPHGVLELLASDNSPDVRIAVGTNLSTPAHIRYSFAFDEDPNVRFGLAEDLSTPLELLDKLAEDSNPYVSCRALETKGIVLSGQEPVSFDCHRFFAWLSKCADRSELSCA